MFEIAQSQHQTQIVTVNKKQLTTGLFSALERFLTSQLSQGKTLICFDFSLVRNIGFSTMAELLEIHRAFSGMIEIAYCALPEHPSFSESSVSLAQLLPLYQSVEEALLSDAFAAAQLRHLQCIVLAGTTPTNILPFFPPTLLPIMGSSVLHHNLHHLAQAGLRRATIDTGQFGAAIHDHLASAPHTPSLEFGFYNSAPSDSHAGADQKRHRLSVLQESLSIFRSDSIVMMGNALPSAALLETYREHQNAAADITLVVPSRSLATIKSGSVPLDEVTCMVIRGGTLDGHSLPNTGFSYRALLQAFTRRGQKVHTVFAGVDNPAITTLQTYFHVLSDALSGAYPQLKHAGCASHGVQWRHKDADIASDLQIRGACYIGPGVKIGRGVRIVGPAAIEAGCEIGRGARVEHSVLSQAHLTPAHGLRREVFAAMDRVVPLRRSPTTTAPLDAISNYAPTPPADKMRAS